MAVSAPHAARLGKRNIRDQCIAANVPFFFKQDAVHGKKLPLPELDGRQWREFPVPPHSNRRRPLG
jgi:protein gp37